MSSLIIEQVTLPELDKIIHQQKFEKSKNGNTIVKDLPLIFLFEN